MVNLFNTTSFTYMIRLAQLLITNWAYNTFSEKSWTKFLLYALVKRKKTEPGKSGPLIQQK